LDDQRQLNALFAPGNILSDLLSLDVCTRQWSVPFSGFGLPEMTVEDLHSGPWSTAGISMQAPASENRVLRSMFLETVLLLLWSIRDTEM
jgi:hypothetical protein